MNGFQYEENENKNRYFVAIEYNEGFQSTPPLNIKDTVLCLSILHLFPSETLTTESIFLERIHNICKPNFFAILT